MIPINVNLKKKLAIYVCDTDGKGTYPLRRAKTIAQSLPKAIEIIFISHQKFDLSLKDSQFISIKNHAELIKALQKIKPDLLLRDSGSTSKEEVEKISEIVPAVIHFDDFGEGGRLADLVIQTLYTETNEKPLEHYVVGAESFIADEQIASFKHIGLNKQETDPIPHLIVTFGDEDSSNLSYRALRHLSQLQIPLKVTVLIGENYKHDKTELRMMALGRRNTFIKQKPENVAEFLSTADIVLCASGYMPYEIGVMGIPCIVLAQNEFETALDFPKEQHGFVHLGPGRKVKQSTLLNAVMEPLLHDSLRKKAIERQVALNLGEGKEMVREAILYYLEYPKRETHDGSGKETSDMV
ncbi:PseG/SpsG family protein [Sporosarcina pasteurii]|uniref:Spore coat polysaccharide biosynthesis protein, predicted glycosyltransferase n=1 Tax=Sporosarcina pasteurii TaxID=1474 RepID=A0A380BD67_SPOPA|nr:CMP-N-acetylneuraminic acid synthetase [Sporosarcina pasteurii]MDS9472357.1 CMP-N-acetylneuraminic acid synthetase [Sporosarcina pasteurii]QBQ06336.1 CMP-N-acetylneuraminic acid synthetase [Sporosarcina pasteurii]SUI98943.1 Spore coat polysaccharide biosynthesis protein, predicted glycosyltransferase [Sporosarcina pasteurii]